jgi:EF hand
MRINLVIRCSILIGSLAAAGCDGAASAAPKRLQPVYDQATGKLQLLKYDANGDGKVDTWSYMDGAAIVRIEIDSDGDGKIDRWEHYGADRRLEKVGTSRSNDGTEDAWSYAGPDGTVARTEISTRRDGRVSRIEHYEKDLLITAEEDVDGDGAVDKWEEYTDGRLASVAFDTAHRGRPDRRLMYGAGGAARLEVRPGGAGDFVAVSDVRTPHGRNRK